MCCFCGRFLQVDGFVGGASYKVLDKSIEVLGTTPDGPNQTKVFTDKAECAAYASNRGWGVRCTPQGEDHVCPDCLRVEQARVEGQREKPVREPGAYVDAALVLTDTKTEWFA